MTIKEKIVDLLSKGDMFAHEIKSALNIGTGFWEAIKELKSEGLICQYFRDTPPSASLCFCLSKNNKKHPLSARFTNGIKPWTPPNK